MMKTALMVLLCALSSVASATKYFVSSSTGNDASDGKSSNTPWKTISKVNASTFNPGDTIAFMKGDVWRETLIVPSSGSSTGYISFSSTFGTGKNPQFLGSTKAITWTETASGSHIWKSATVISANPYTSNSAEIFYENSDGTKSWGTYKTGTASLTAEYNWTWVSNNIYVYSATDPTTRYNSVEIPQRESTVNMNKKNYLHFDGIDMFYSIHSGYGYDYTHNDMYEQFGLIIENSNIGYIGAWDPSLETGYGIEVVYTDMVVRKNTIYDCGRRGFAMDIYGNGYTAKNILVEDNEFFDGFHTTGLDIDVGAGYNGNLDNITIRRNYFHETSQARNTDLSNLIFIQNNAVGSCTITNVYIYDNIFKWQNGYGILTEGVQSVFVYNNVFFEKATVCPTWASYVAAQANSHITANNNIFYGGSSGSSMDALDLTSPYFTHDYNLFFSTASETETHGQFSKNPLFVDAANNNFHLQATSPAIGTGVAISSVTTDYEGQPFSNPPNMGCFATQTGTPALSYVSSVIENATPSILSMTYSLSLANIVPASSAFTVMVNSVTRGIGSVAIVSGKVQLTLSSPVVYGDVITVSYTKPATNPLQTTSGGQAASITAQTVTNNCSAVIPVYVSSAIENATPSILSMTYNLSLASIVPASSAFTVMVNSVIRGIGSVAIVSGKVQLTLSSPVVYGDVITVSYTKPATNPLQTTSGGQAASISTQPVNNNINNNNSSPVIVLTYNKSIYSGFIGLVDASSSYDANNDPLTYEWIVPSNVEVSSKTSSKIQFLAPRVWLTQTINFTLKLSDGKSIQSKSITINVIPYRPRYYQGKIYNITSSGLKGSNDLHNVIDNDLKTSWSTNEPDQWLIFELERPIKVAFIEMAFAEGQKLQSHFDLWGSKDNLIWEPLLNDATSSDFADGFQVFEIPESNSTTEYSFFKLVDHGNAKGEISYISEFQIFGSLDIKKVELNIYPNPASDNVNISIIDPILNTNDNRSVQNRIIKIVDIRGVVVLEKALEPDVNFIQIPLNLLSGNYMVDLFSGGTLVAAKKLIVRPK